MNQKAFAKLVTHLAPGHYLNQHWLILNLTFEIKFQWNLNEIATISYQKIGMKILSAKWYPFCLSLKVLIWLKIGGHMGTNMWVNIGSGNGLMPDGIKPLLETLLTNYQWVLVAFTLKGISQEILKISVLDRSFKIINQTLQQHLLGPLLLTQINFNQYG